MKIGIVDADLIGRKKHRFPNLVCEKLSGYWKARGAEVTLLMDYDHFDEYDTVYVSKVFTDTPVPEWLCETERIHIGGTGFYFDKAPNLPDEIEPNDQIKYLGKIWLVESVGYYLDKATFIDASIFDDEFIKAKSAKGITLR